MSSNSNCNVTLVMPEELSKLIQDYARPITHPNWRQGGSFNSKYFHSGLHLKYYESYENLWFHDNHLGIMYYNAYSGFIYNL